ncbi:MAG TPA: RuBisCO large subunit C-terminal-like domain-containing protein [Nitrospiria bacterium]|nr:RuBisCO large subunit C-terminal-like domain-containing protein [Nitrospiria bacterium]
METIRVHYDIAAKDVKRAARLVAREQSLGVRVTQYEHQRVKAMEAAVTTIRRGRNRALVAIDVVSEPIESAYGLILSIAGEISCLNAMRTIQLVDFELPSRLAGILGGPRFGAEGLRQALGVHGRPVFVSVVKPSQGLTPKEFGNLAYECFVGGIDVCKTDELLQERREDYLARVRACAEAARRAEAETGEPKRFMIHAVGPADQLVSLYEAGVEAGGGIAMCAPAAAGFPNFHALASLGRVPLMAHMAMSGWLWQRHGMSVAAWAKFVRLFGADVTLYPALQGSLKATRTEVETIKRVCEAPLHGLRPSFPAVGGGQHAATLEVHARLFGREFIFLCGGGVVGHPQGARAGARSIRQAWGAVETGVPVARYAKQAPELAAALNAFAKYV